LYTGTISLAGGSGKLKVQSIVIILFSVKDVFQDTRNYLMGAGIVVEQ
jgi:hypothetical protein